MEQVFTFNNKELRDENFLKFKTISKRINGEKLRLKISWNDTIKHDLVKRLDDRTNLKSISELNDLLENGLDELYIKNYSYIIHNDRYSLWFSEYDFSVIVDIYNDQINIVTIIPKMTTYNVRNVIELKSVL